MSFHMEISLDFRMPLRSERPLPPGSLLLLLLVSLPRRALFSCSSGALTDDSRASLVFTSGAFRGFNASDILRRMVLACAALCDFYAIRLDFNGG
jgi:hypothetical protein